MSLVTQHLARYQHGKNKRDMSTASRARLMLRFRVDYYYNRVVHCAPANHRDMGGT